MKSIELRKVPCGETFTAFGEEYVVLDHVDGGVLSIRKGIWKKAAFDRGWNSNLAQADMRDTLAEYAEFLKSKGAKDSDLLIQRVDLKATDGTRVYGYLDCTVALLTLEQYGKYKEIIPKADYARAKIDAAMKLICGDSQDFIPFEQRYEWLPEIRYDRRG